VCPGRWGACPGRVIRNRARADRFAAVFTTNHDELVEDALKARSVRFVPQILQHGYRLQARAELSVLKLHGSRTDWASVILSGQSYQRFHATYPLLANQLDLNLRVHPLLFDRRSDVRTAGAA